MALKRLERLLLVPLLLSKDSSSLSLSLKGLPDALLPRDNDPSCCERLPASGVLWAAASSSLESLSTGSVPLPQAFVGEPVAPGAVLAWWGIAPRTGGLLGAGSECLAFVGVVLMARAGVGLELMAAATEGEVTA